MHRPEVSVKPTFLELEIEDSDLRQLLYLMSLARPNFHSTSDCCWKGNCEVCTGAQSAKAACLDPLVGVRHHRNQKVDQHHGGHQHVESENKLKLERVS